MKGQRGYEAVTIRVRHADVVDDIDPDVQNAIEIMSSPRLYEGYLHSQGAVLVGRLNYTKYHRVRMCLLFPLKGIGD